MKSTLSAVIIAKNEEENLAKCLPGLRFCDEVVVVDDYSEDNTALVARRLRAKVYTRALNHDFAAQRNYGLARATGAWVLFVDADELVSRELAKQIRRAIKSSDKVGFLVHRQDNFLGKPMQGGEWGGTWLLRLARKSSGEWKRAVHEKWVVAGEAGRLSSPLLHSPFESVSLALSKLNRYSVLHAKENEKAGKKADFTKIIFFPLAKFVYNFVLKRGYRDGTHGFVYSVMMSFHSFLAWSNQWAWKHAKN